MAESRKPLVTLLRKISRPDWSKAIHWWGMIIWYCLARFQFLSMITGQPQPFALTIGFTLAEERWSSRETKTTWIGMSFWLCASQTSCNSSSIVILLGQHVFQNTNKTTPSCGAYSESSFIRPFISLTVNVGQKLCAQQIVAIKSVTIEKTIFFIRFQFVVCRTTNIASKKNYLH